MTICVRCLSAALLLLCLSTTGIHLRAETAAVDPASPAGALSTTPGPGTALTSGSGAGAPAFSSSLAAFGDPGGGAAVASGVVGLTVPVHGFVGANGAKPTAVPKPFSAVGIAVRVGFGGIGFDIATPVAPHLNLRTGMDFFSYSDTFTEQGANVAINLKLRSAHANLDWFPFHNWLRVSPLLVFANNNGVRATVLVPPGSDITLNGSNYISSLTDPLNGSGSVDFSKVAPGLTIGTGNLVPRSRGHHLSFPTELGFYYVGQPTLKVAFTGSACDPTQPPATGCQSVTTDQSFQQSLAAFIARNNHNLSYAKFFPVLSFGVGYSF